MRSWLRFGVVALAFVGCQPAENGQTPGSESERFNPMIALQEQEQPVFGLYAPRARSRDATEVKTPAQLAEETIAFTGSDYVFNSSMEGGVDEGLAEFQTFASAMHDAGATAATHPLVVKMEKISEDPNAAEHIGQQLNAGVSAIMFVHVESAEELERGLAAMRFESNGGTRSEADVGYAPTYWGMSEEQYREAADLWPLNPDGELLSWVIVESREGLEHIDEIASVPGIGVLWPGAGTLRGVFSTEDANGNRVLDEEGWENAIQTVLNACNEHNLACGYPAGPDDIEMRMAQGFDVFVMSWGEPGFETVEIGKRLASR